MLSHLFPKFHIILQLFFIQDLPDVEGDKMFNINTFAGKYGIKAVANTASASLATAYIGAIILAFIARESFKTIPMALGHAALLSYFTWGWSRLDTSKMTSVKKFYKVIWNLFYLEYCLYPFI